MPTRDNTSQQRIIMAFNAVITSNTTTNGPVLDTAEFDMGIMFGISMAEFSAGSFQILIEEDNDAAFTSSNVVTSDFLIEALPGALVAATTINTQLQVFGIQSTKRFVRLSVVSTGASGNNRFLAVSVQRGEFAPVFRT